MSKFIILVGGPVVGWFLLVVLAKLAYRFTAFAWGLA